MSRLAFAFLLALFLAAPGPAGATDEISGAVEFSYDRDDARQYGIYAGYRHAFEDTPTSLGLKAGTLTLKDPAGSERFQVLEVQNRSRPFPWARLDVRARLLDGDDWSPFLYALTASGGWRERWNYEVFGERGIVDTVPSVRLEYLIDTWGFSVDYAATDEITLVGALFTQGISDGNDRFGTIGRIVFTPGKVDWLNLQVKARVLTSEFDGTGYFSPERMSEVFVLAGVARAFAGDNWIIRGLGGPGIQRVEDHDGTGESKTAYLLEGRLKGWFTPEFGLEASFGCTTAQQTGASSQYCYGGVQLTRIL